MFLNSDSATPGADATGAGTVESDPAAAPGEGGWPTNLPGTSTVNTAGSDTTGDSHTTQSEADKLRQDAWKHHEISLEYAAENRRLRERLAEYESDPAGYTGFLDPTGTGNTLRNLGGQVPEEDGYVN